MGLPHLEGDEVLPAVEGVGRAGHGLDGHAGPGELVGGVGLHPGDVRAHDDGAVPLPAAQAHLPGALGQGGVGIVRLGGPDEPAAPPVPVGALHAAQARGRHVLIDVEDLGSRNGQDAVVQGHRARQVGVAGHAVGSGGGLTLDLRRAGDRRGGAGRTDVGGGHGHAQSALGVELEAGAGLQAPGVAVGGQQAQLQDDAAAGGSVIGAGGVVVGDLPVHPAGQAVEGRATGRLVAAHEELGARVVVAGPCDAVGPRQQGLALPACGQRGLGVEGHDEVAPLAAQVDEHGTR